MKTEILILLLSLISTAVGYFIRYLVTRRKNKAETLSIELDNATKVINIWKGLSEEQFERIKDNEIKIDALYKELKVLEQKYAEQCENCKYKKQAINM